MNHSILLIAVIIIAISILINSPDKRTKKLYSGSFMDERKILSKFNKGFCITGKRCLDIETSTKHVLITGASGNFKSSGILIPGILKCRGHASLIINDPSGELLHLTSGALLQAGYIIKVLNCNKPCECFNPLKRATSNSAIKKISKLLITTSLGNGGKDPFFNLSAENICTLGIQYVCRYMPEEFHTLANVYYLISSMSYAAEKVDRLFVKTDPLMLAEYKSFLSYGERTLSAIIATARAALSMFATDENVALVTSHDTISFEDFRMIKTALFINNSVSTMKYHAITTSIFLDQFFEQIMSYIPDKKKVFPCWFFLDEASSLIFNNLQITIANLRKHFAGICQAYQSTSQIIDLYGAPVARAIVENSYTRIYMPGQPLNVALELETLMGKAEFKDEKNATHIRSLLTANEIHELNESLIFCGNNPAIKTEVVPYFKQFFLNRLTKIPPFVPTCKIPFSEPPVFQFT